MITFREYLARRDEASFNFSQKLGTGGGLGGIAGKVLGGEGGDMAKYFAHVPGAAVGALPAVAGGLGKTAGVYRSMTRGNPYISDSPEKTKALAGNVFNRSSSWLLNRVANERLPAVRSKLIAVLQQGVGELQNNFRSQQPQTHTATGVTVGKQPTALGNIFALPVSIISGLKAAAKNVIDTMNPAYRTEENEWSGNIEKMVLSLDALRTVIPMDLVDSYIKTFLHNLEKGWDAYAREIGSQ